MNTIKQAKKPVKIISAEREAEKFRSSGSETSSMLANSIPQTQCSELLILFKQILFQNVASMAEENLVFDSH